MNEDKLTNILLWRRIAEASLLIADPFDHSFNQRLKSKYGWSTKKAIDLIWEYRKFLYLSTMMRVVPSPEVDKVWHEHILFTKDYDRWTDILGKELHHEPERPGVRNTNESDWRNTKDRYLGEFGDTKEYQRYWLGLNAWQRFFYRRKQRQNERRNNRRDRGGYGGGSSGSSDSGGFWFFPIFSSSCSSTSDSGGGSSCSGGSGCSGGGCGGGCGG